MGLAEGGSDPSVVNKQGYAGQFQFGSERLADLGLYTPAPGEGKNGWKGQFHIAPYNVSTLQDFLNNPAAQHAAFVAHVADIDKAIANTPGADKFDQNGLRAVAHLGGVGGMRAFIASGGNLNSQDANGTSLKNYYQRFASGGPVALQQAFGSVHGPGGPPGSGPGVQPGGNVSTAWVDPNAPLPVPPIPPAGGPPPAFNPNTGPRVAGASPAGAPGSVPVVTPQAAPGVAPTDLTTGHSGRPTVYPPPPTITGQADETAVAPSRIAMRTGGTDTAGPGAGQATVPSDAQPNQLAYGTDLPGVTIGLPTNGMAPPPAAAAPVTTTTAPATPTAAPAAQAKPPVLQPPPALQRAIPPKPVLPSGLTAADTEIVAGMVQARTPTAQVAQFIEAAKQRNTALQQQYLANQAAVDQANFERQKYYTEQLQKTGWEPQPDGSLKNKYTGDTKWPPTPRMQRDEAGNLISIGPGGNTTVVSPNPSGVTGNGPEASALRTMNEIGPKIAAGTATPQEQTNYASATEVYRDPTILENSVTKERSRVYTRELPPGFPQPPNAGGGAPGSNVVMPGYSPQQQQVERDPAAYKVAESQYDRDSKEIGAIGDVGRQAQADQVRIKEMQDVLQRFSTGSGTEARTAASNWLQRWLPAGVTGWEKESANLSGSDAAQAFSKMALVGAGTQERGVLGARGGYQAIKLFKEANPNVNLQDATNKSILDMQLISNQANQDYSQSALSHFADNETKFGQTHQYDSLAQFDRNWNSQRNPQVYAAAMGAISGQPPTQWAKGLSDAEYKRALDIVSRANPSATVNGKSGPISMQPQAGQGQAASPAAAPVSVKTPADAAALPPGTPYTTPDGRRFVR